MYKEDLALSNLQGLICYKIHRTNQSKYSIDFVRMTQFHLDYKNPVFKNLVYGGFRLIDWFFLMLCQPV